MNPLASHAGGRGFASSRAAVLLAGAMCVVPFLLPRHMPPLRTFYDEWLAIALGLAALGLCGAARRTADLRVPGLAAWLGAFALFLVARAFGADTAYAQSSLLWALYALFAALMICLGRELASRCGREQVCDAIAACLLVGALANAAAGALQVIGIPPFLDAFVSRLHGGRAIGNVGQANLYANYLALGAASLLYLNARGRLALSMTIASATLLLAGISLGASRATAAYLGLFALLAWLALRRNRAPQSRRLVMVSLLLALGGLLAFTAGPAVLRMLGDAVESGIHRNPAIDAWLERDASVQLRVGIWELAWRLFAANPWLGVGPGQFAGAAFAAGLTPYLGAEGVWTSAHNLALQLLAETGLLGALIVGTGLAIWARHASAEFLRKPDLPLWWVTACAGVGFTHALLEYPFWYAHFLALTALAVGIGSPAGWLLRWPANRAALAATAVAGSALLANILVDYLRFDAASPVAAGRSLAPEHVVLQDRAALRELGKGLLAPRAEMWLFLALPLDSDDLAGKILAGERVLRVWPSEQVVARQSVFLALAGRQREALSLLARGLQTYANRHAEIAAVLAGAPPQARESLQSALQPARH